MGFNLKSTLKALLFSTADSLSIKDVQEVITRYHYGRPEPVDDQTEVLVKGGLSSETSDRVPSLLTSAQIRETCFTSR